MFTLTTKIYDTKAEVVSYFEEYKDAVNAAEHMVKVFRHVMPLTRHNSVVGVISGAGSWGDLYNEVAVVVKPVEPIKE